MKIYRNRTFEFIATISGLDDLIGYTATCKIAKRDDKQSVLDLVGTIPDPAVLEVTFKATPAQTKELTMSLYYREIVLTKDDDKYTSGLETIESVEMLKEE